MSSILHLPNADVAPHTEHTDHNVYLFYTECDSVLHSMSFEVQVVFLQPFYLIVFSVFFVVFF